MSKVQTQHLERKAYVYVRQSSLAQVRHHRESTQRQYSFRERAVQLGWRSEQVEVIDEDQGQSGASSENRGGFQRLVSEVALGQVGGILGLEMSRLARSCADWYRLLEVAALTKTLIVDEEGVYDPNHYNDRLLLGLKGTLSEAELHFLKQRMIGGRRNKAQRGEFRIRLGVGYVWEEDERIQMDPDERVRDVLHLFFRCFERLGTAASVARFFEENRQLFPRRDGWGNPQAAVTWGPLGVSRAVEILKNPQYAGIYAYNRHCTESMDPEDPCAGGRIWKEGSHPGYITVEQYEKNVARLVSNRNLYGGMRNKGSAREGKSLLQGIVLCGICGRSMNVVYRTDNSFVYSCRCSQTRRMCQEVHGRHVELLIEEVILETLSREELELAVGALKKLSERAKELDRQWQKRIEAARYEADRAARRYHQVEPENRLVVRTLESEWNTRLEELELIEKQYAEVKKSPPLELTEEQRQQILSLAEDLPRLWKAPTTQNSQRKEIVRILIEDVTLRNVDEPWSIDVAIRWKSGAVGPYRAERVKPYPWTTAPEIVSRIRDLNNEKTDKEIADVLNAEDYRTGYGKAFTEARVYQIRSTRELKKPRGLGRKSTKVH